MNSADEANSPGRKRRLIVAEEGRRARERYRKFVGIDLHTEISGRECRGGRFAIHGEDVPGTVYPCDDHRVGIGGPRGRLAERWHVGGRESTRGLRRKPPP